MFLDAAKPITVNNAIGNGLHPKTSFAIAVGSREANEASGLCTKSEANELILWHHCEILQQSLRNSANEFCILLQRPQ